MGIDERKIERDIKKVFEKALNDSLRKHRGKDEKSAAKAVKADMKRAGLDASDQWAIDAVRKSRGQA